MPVISQKRFHSTIRGPAAQALDYLAAQSTEMIDAWVREASGPELHIDQFIPREALDFASLADHLRKSSFESLRKQVEALGKQLAQRGAKIEAAVAALNRLFEMCLALLAGDFPLRAAPMLGLARLHALIGTLLIGGYTGSSIEGQQTLIEASLSEAEHRFHSASSYVTKIYEGERRRISHDLHDEIGHDLILIKLYLEMISVGLKHHDLPEIKPRLNDAIALVGHTIDSVRRLVLDLGPAVLEELGFLPALRSYAGQFSARTKIKITVQEGYLPENIPPTHEVALYRLMQGALSNVLKHARARNVRISLGSMKDSVLIMVIEDDGVGFDPAAKPGRRSYGLTAMRERVEVLGGRIHVESRRAGASGKKHGTRIEVDLPLPGGEEK